MREGTLELANSKVTKNAGRNESSTGRRTEGDIGFYGNVSELAIRSLPAKKVSGIKNPAAGSNPAVSAILHAVILVCSACADQAHWSISCAIPAVSAVGIFIFFYIKKKIL